MVYKPDRAGLAALQRSSEFQHLADQGANEGLAYAESIAPVLTGAYRDAFRVVSSGDGEAYIVNDDPGAIAIEVGAPARPGFHVLGRTVDYLEGQ